MAMLSTGMVTKRMSFSRMTFGVIDIHQCLTYVEEIGRLLVQFVTDKENFSTGK